MARTLERPLLIEGRAGVGKTEIANVMADLLGAKLIRLQCYEGLDVTTALYEWNYARQLLWTRLDEGSGLTTEERERHIFSPRLPAGAAPAVRADPAGQAAGAAD